METTEYNKFVETYWDLRREGETLLEIAIERIKEQIPLYFWPNEEPNKLQVYGRVKSLDSFHSKIQGKITDLSDKQLLTQTKTDFCALRFIVSRRNQISRAIELIRQCNFWDIEVQEAFSDNELDNVFFKQLGLDVKNRDGGYCGIHFDVKMKEANGMVQWLEIQIHTKIQDAWQDIDHIFYKTDRLPSSFSTLRESIAQQFESLEKSQQCIFEYIDTEITKGNIQCYGSDLYSAVDWSHKWGLPKDYINKIIKGETFDSCYVIMPDLSRKILVHNVLERPVAIVTSQFIEKHNPDTYKNIIVVSDDFVGATVLSGLIGLNEVL